MKEGVKEIIIVSQDSGMYGRDLKYKSGVIELLKKITELNFDFKLRVMYLNPDRITKEYVEYISENKKICKYIDMPIQHTENEILKKMRRGYTREELLKKIYFIRKCNPDIALRTVVITGYPGETGTVFNNMLDALKKIRFDKLSAFHYYDEPGTYSYNLPVVKKIDEDLKNIRLEKIMLQQMKISMQINKKFVGKILPVLVEGYDKKSGYYIGRTEYNAPEIDGYVFFKLPYNKKNIDIINFLNIKIKGYSEYDLTGELIL